MTGEIVQHSGAVHVGADESKDIAALRHRRILPESALSQAMKTG
jgi:hypothetical protein